MSCHGNWCYPRLLLHDWLFQPSNPTDPPLPHQVPEVSRLDATDTTEVVEGDLDEVVEGGASDQTTLPPVDGADLLLPAADVEGHARQVLEGHRREGEGTLHQDEVDFILVDPGQILQEVLGGRGLVGPGGPVVDDGGLSTIGVHEVGKFLGAVEIMC